MKHSSWLGRAGEGAAWAISAVAWALSFTAQMTLAGQHGFVSWEVWAWPATTDLAGLTGMLIALDQARRHQSTLVAWLIALAAAAVMVAANIGSSVGDPVAMLLHAWPPSIALACWFLLVHVRKVGQKDMDHDMDQDIMSTTVAVSANGRKPMSTKEAVEQLFLRHGPDISADMIAVRLGISQRHASRLLAEVKRPSLVAKG